jgi:hypothetical protein
MPIPALTKRGVLPPGSFDCTRAEVVESFCDGPRRAELWKKFEAFLNEVDADHMPTRLYVDGSFTSDKSEPGDIDVVFDLSECAEEVQNHWLRVQFLEQQRIKAQYAVDFWVYLSGTSNDLRAFFSYVRPEEALRRGMLSDEGKGLLSLIL